MIGDLQGHWREMEQAHKAFLGLLAVFLSIDKKERISFLQEKYKTSPGLVIEILGLLNPEELKEFLPFLIKHVRSVHGHLFNLRKVILSLPGQWLVEEIEAVVEPWLQTGDDEYFRRFLELYYLIDENLTRRLAERAVTSSNADIREAGEDFLEKLEERK